MNLSAKSLVLSILGCLIICHSLPGVAQSEVKVSIKPVAVVVSGGNALQISVSITCDPFGDLLEALVTVENEQVFGDGFFGSIVCDGNRHSYLVTAQPHEGVFSTGQARISAFALFCDDQAQDCVSGQDTRKVRVRKSKVASNPK